MASVICPNCQKRTPVIPPKYQCKFCHQSLKPESSNSNSGPSFNIEPDDYDIDINIGYSPDEADGSEKTIVGSADPLHQSISVLKKEQNNNPDKIGKTTIAWLIVHDEQKAPVSYDLFIGDNFFGTKADGYAVDIAIKNDKYVSRSHANIRINKDFMGRFHYELLDDGSRRPQGPSLNGTYVNGNHQRLPANGKVYLQDGDTIQVGETKLVFKTKQESKGFKEAATAVLKSDYTSTVFLSR